MKTPLSLALVVALTFSALATEEVTPIDAVDLDALRAKAGTPAVVIGQVTDVGTTQDGGITFVNVGMPKKKGFVAVIFRQNYESFPDGFEKFRNQKVKVSGPIELYKSEQPQIILRSPDQIEIVKE
ncbi:MAG: hypothetical protein WEB60_06745 [Terrimicrobiaceae bacterium]